MLPRPATRLLTVVAVLASLFVAPQAHAAGATFGPGDVLVGVGKSKVQWRAPDGTLKTTLTTFASEPDTTGLGFDAAGKLYSTGYTSNVISVFNADGTPAGTFGPSSAFSSHPE